MQVTQPMKSKRSFEMLDSRNHEIIDQVKEVVESGIQQQLDTRETTNFLSLISDKLNEDFKKLSALFSSKEGCTLETFIDQRKIEKVKEFLVYTDLSLPENCPCFRLYQPFAFVGPVEKAYWLHFFALQTGKARQT